MENENSRSERVKSWNNHPLVLLSQQLPIELQCDYFDYISGKSNLRNAKYIETYRENEIAIKFHVAYNGWIEISAGYEKIKAKVLKSIMAGVGKLIEQEKGRVDELIETKKQRDEFTKDFSEKYNISIDELGHLNPNWATIGVNLNSTHYTFHHDRITKNFKVAGVDKTFSEDGFLKLVALLRTI